MSDITESLEVKFSTSLPLGTRGTFEYNGQVWIAYPAKKNQAIFAVTDKMLGAHKRVIKDILGWVKQRPQDAELVQGAVQIASAAIEMHNELLVEKTESRVE